MPQSAAFGESFRQLIAGTSQAEVGRKLGVTQAYVSRMAGGQVPKREVVHRLINAFRLDRTEWLSLAGYADTAAASEEDERFERIVDAAARRVMQQIAPLLGSERIPMAAGAGPVAYCATPVDKAKLPAPPERVLIWPAAELPLHAETDWNLRSLQTYEDVIAETGSATALEDSMSSVCVISTSPLGEFANLVYVHRERLNRLWIVTPWIASEADRTDPLRLLVDALQGTRCDVQMITRPPTTAWHSTALQLLERDTRLTLYYCRNLHAKLYIMEADGFRCALLGSPNLTPSGNKTNREIAVEFRTTKQGRFDDTSTLITDLTEYVASLRAEDDVILVPRSKE